MLAALKELSTHDPEGAARAEVVPSHPPMTITSAKSIGISSLQVAKRFAKKKRKVVVQAEVALAEPSFASLGTE